jgi:acyl-CoA dehydrogenase
MDHRRSGEYAGQGWRMLMECLATGRARYHCPRPTARHRSKLALRVTDRLRPRAPAVQASPVGRFEGIEEPLARMGGNLYAMDAARTMTAGAIDLGEKPSVVSAIVKYHVTERTRQVVNDAMDILGGKGICLGPNNFMGRAYQQMPVAITVEGANILTRSLIIFGQGAIRCHPYVLKEMAAARNPDAVEGLRDFDAAFAAHLGFIWTRGFRSWSMGLTGSNFAAGTIERRRRRRGATTSSCRVSRRPSPSSPTFRCSSWAATSSARRSSPRAWATSFR